MQPRILMINPPIYDFAAYDLYSKPLGMLYLASILRQQGYQVDFLDCLDRRHPAMLQNNWLHLTRDNGSGKYYAQEAPKPACVAHVPRPYRRYGMPAALLDSLLPKYLDPEPPLAVLVGSMMTYWYPGVADTIARVRHWLPGVPIALGGIYATLMPEHAQRYCQPDRIFPGPDMRPLQAWLAALHPHGLPNMPTEVPLDFADWPLPAYELYGHPLDALTVMTSVGCPFRCEYCCSSVLQPKVGQIPARLFAEGLRELLTYAIKDEACQGYHVAFADDALLWQTETHFLPILSHVKQLKLPVRFYCPNGLHLRYITPAVAQAMHEADFRMIRLSYEASSAQSMGQKVSSNKVDDGIFAAALANLRQAGYRSEELEAYILTGLPGQTLKEMENSALAVHQHGVKIKICQYTPIPGTALFETSCRQFDVDPTEPLLHNNSTLPIFGKQLGYERFQEFKNWVKQLNRELGQGEGD